MVKVKLKSGLVVVGELMNEHLSQSPSISVLQSVPLHEKVYIDSTSKMIAEKMGNGANRCVYLSDKFRLKFKKDKTIATIFNSTIQEIINL